MIVKLASIRIDPASITMDSNFATDLVFDSIGLVSLLALCGEHFGIDLEGSTKKIGEIHTVGDAIALIRELAPTRVGSAISP